MLMDLSFSLKKNGHIFQPVCVQVIILKYESPRVCQVKFKYVNKKDVFFTDFYISFVKTRKKV